MALIWRLLATVSLVLVIICAIETAEGNDNAWNDAKVLTEFEKWMKKFGKDKVYGSNPIRKLKRFKAFKDNLLYMVSHNNISSSSFLLGLNQFADLSFDEAVASGLIGRTPGDNKTSTYQQAPVNATVCYPSLLPKNFDWRSRGVVTPVKDQGQCGSCWAFSSVATIESAYAISTGRLYRLSDQEVLSCENTYSYGCNGGYQYYALRWVINNGGIASEADYPYVSGYTGITGICDVVKARTRKVAKISAIYGVPTANEAALLCALSKRPISVSIYANNDFLRYASGIFDAGTSCPYGAGTANHAVTLVGWGQNAYGVKYWIVKNSWGRYWGVNGYAYIRRGGSIPQGVCGINNYPLYPVV